METLCFCWYLNYVFPVDAFGSVVSAMGKTFFLPGGGRIRSGKGFLPGFSYCLHNIFVNHLICSNTEWVVQPKSSARSRQQIRTLACELRSNARLQETKQDHSPAHIFILFKFLLDSFNRNSVYYHIHLESPSLVPCHFKRFELAHLDDRKTESHIPSLMLVPVMFLEADFSDLYWRHKICT